MMLQSKRCGCSTPPLRCKTLETTLRFVPLACRLLRQARVGHAIAAEAREQRVMPLAAARELRLSTPAGEVVGWVGSSNTPSLPCFIFVHGATERASEEWSTAGQALVSAGMTVVLLDMPGYGASAASAPRRLPTKSEDYAANGGAADVVWAAAGAAVAALHGENAASAAVPVVLCGASMGGGHVLSAAVKHGLAAANSVKLSGLVLWYPSFKESAHVSLIGLAKAKLPVLQCWAKDDPMHPPAKTIFTLKWGDGFGALAKGFGATTHVFRKKTAFHGADCEAVAATVDFAQSLLEGAAPATAPPVEAAPSCDPCCATSPLGGLAPETTEAAADEPHDFTSVFANVDLLRLLLSFLPVPSLVDARSTCWAFCTLVTASDLRKRLQVDRLLRLKQETLVEIAGHHQLVINNWVGEPVPSWSSGGAPFDSSAIYAELWSEPERFDPCAVLSMRTAAQLVEASQARLTALDTELAAMGAVDADPTCTCPGTDAKGDSWR